MSSHEASERLLAIIAAQNEVIATGLELDAVMHLVVLKARTLTGAEAAALELIEGEEMVSATVAGTAEAYPGLRVRRDSSLSGMCVTLDQVLRSDDTAVDPRVNRDVCARVRAGSMICAPVRHDGAVVGVLKIYSAQPHSFGEADERTLELLGELVGARMTNASRLAGEDESGDRDALTGLYNRAAYDDRLVHEAERARRYEHQLGLVLLDLDGFKAINAKLGHPAGDRVLKEIGAVLSSSRFADAAFRIGGDEFAVLLPETDFLGAETAGDRLAERIAAIGLDGAQVSASWGAASHAGDPLALHERADTALLKAKFGPGRRFASDADPDAV